MKKVLNLTILFVLVSITTHAQKIRMELCEEFRSADKIYLLDYSANTTEFKNSRGNTFTFEELVIKYWPNKEIIKIDPDDYKKLKGVKKLFHISIQTFKVKREENHFVTHEASLDGIIIQKGKARRSPKNTLYWMSLNLNEIRQGILAERLEYAVSNLRSIIRNCGDNSERSIYLYQIEGFKEYLAENTLYINEENLQEDLKTVEAVKELYPFPFQILSREDWIQAISNQKKGTIYLDFIPAGYYTAIDIYTTDGSTQLMSSLWVREHYRLNTNFFERTLRDPK